MIKHIFAKNSFGYYFKKYKLAFASSFSIGVLISTIAYSFKFIDKYKAKKFLTESELKTKQMEKNCKDEYSDYAKFLNLGFPNTAMEKFNYCMKEK